MFNAVLVQDFPEKRDIVDPEFKCFLYAKEKFEIKNKILHRRVGDKLVVVLPNAMVGDVFKHYHTLAGHFSPDKVYKNVSESYYIYKLLPALQLYTSKCKICLKFNKAGVGNAPPLQLTASRPNRKLFIDCVGPLPESTEGFSQILLGTDGYS